ncbi:hypothetical protein IQ264_07845 [Phormidium sp. LEGE 05292]|nr:hypothetical protein [Phormidium sp. LEGE 05292]
MESELIYWCIVNQVLNRQELRSQFLKQAHLTVMLDAIDPTKETLPSNTVYTND